MIRDVTGVILTPGNGGKDCRGNGRTKNFWGKWIECCCDECDYLICCTEGSEEMCQSCRDTACPRKKGK